MVVESVQTVQMVEQTLDAPDVELLRNRDRVHPNLIIYTYIYYQLYYIYMYILLIEWCLNNKRHGPLSFVAVLPAGDSLETWAIGGNTRN